MVFFFKDLLSSHPHEADINMLIRVCDVHNAPLATNEATAQLLLNAIALQSSRFLHLHFLANMLLEPFHELERFFR